MKEFQPVDIFFTQSPTFLGKAIRLMTRKIGEPRTQVNHVGLIMSEDHEGTAWGVEATGKGVKLLPVLEYHRGRGNKIAVYRATNIDDIWPLIYKEADSYIGKSYGFFKIIAHFLDWCLLGSYVFRRLARMDKYPICSWLVASAYGAAGLDFGVTINQASPDDIWDFVNNNPDKYECILPLE